MSNAAGGTPMTSPGGNNMGEDPILEPVNGQVYPPTMPRKDCPGRMTNQVSILLNSAEKFWAYSSPPPNDMINFFLNYRCLGGKI
jgi:hypothetical protein